MFSTSRVLAVRAASHFASVLLMETYIIIYVYYFRGWKHPFVYARKHSRENTGSIFFTLIYQK